MSYDPAIGRWLEQDPDGYVNGANLYQFVESNPLRYVDPLGLGATIGQPLPGNSNFQPGAAAARAQQFEPFFEGYLTAVANLPGVAIGALQFVDTDGGDEEDLDAAVAKEEEALEEVENAVEKTEAEPPPGQCPMEGKCFVAGTQVVMASPPTAELASTLGSRHGGLQTKSFAVGLLILAAGPMGYYLLTSLQEKRRKTDGSPPDDELEPVWIPLRPGIWRSGCGWLGHARPGTSRRYVIGKLVG
jgi:hypothetical protein